MHVCSEDLGGGASYGCSVHGCGSTIQSYLWYVILGSIHQLILVWSLVLWTVGLVWECGHTTTTTVMFTHSQHQTRSRQLYNYDCQYTTLNSTHTHIHVHTLHHTKKETMLAGTTVRNKLFIAQVQWPNIPVQTLPVHVRESEAPHVQ